MRKPELTFIPRLKASTFAVAIGLVSTLFTAQHVMAQSATATLKTLEGHWTGAGVLTRDNGGTERIRCQADYAAKAPSGLQQSLSCSSDSTHFDLQSNLSENGGALSGDWTETNRNARGNLTGKVSGNTITAAVQGPGFTAGIGIGVKGNRQDINIKAQGGDITGLTMSLARGR